MITRNDILLLLNDLKKKGVNVNKYLQESLKSSSISLEALKFINDNRQLDVVRFYEKLRKSYNNKKSKLYINIVKSDENLLTEPKTILTTLSSMLNQILLFDAEDKPMFYQHIRADEILQVLNIYFRTYNLEPAIKLIQLIKADLKSLEMIK